MFVFANLIIEGLCWGTWRLALRRFFFKIAKPNQLLHLNPFFTEITWTTENIHRHVDLNQNLLCFSTIPLDVFVATCNIFTTPHPNRHSPAGWGGHDAENCVGVQAEWIGSDCPGDPLSGHVVVPGGRSQKGEVNTHLTMLSDTVTHFQMNLLMGLVSRWDYP